MWKRLGSAGIKPGPSRHRERHGHALTEGLALTPSLLFRMSAPMRNRDNMRAVVAGIKAMGCEETACWLGMATHSKRLCRVLTALRILLTGHARRTVEARD